MERQQIKWGEERCCTEKDIDRRSQIGRGRADKDGKSTET